VHDDLAHEAEGDGLNADGEEKDAEQEKGPVGDAATRHALEKDDHEHDRADPARDRAEEAEEPQRLVGELEQEQN
jgi:hypothetical protein